GRAGSGARVRADPAARGHRLQLDAAPGSVGPGGSAVRVRDGRDAEPGGDRGGAVRARVEAAPTTGEVRGQDRDAEPPGEHQGTGGGGARVPEHPAGLGRRGGVRVPTGGVSATVSDGRGTEEPIRGTG